MNENLFLKKYTAKFLQSKNVIAGPGDDSAVIHYHGNKLMLLTVDQLISGIHYDPKETSPGQAAVKLVRRNISDIAAMGGKPAYALLTVSANFAKKDFASKWLPRFFDAIAKEARKWDLSVCGGDISSNSSERCVFTMSIIGFVEKRALCLRSGAKGNDLLFATGYFGGSYRTNHHLNFQPRLNEAHFLAGKFTNTMIDVSDGLLLDASRIAEMSKTALELFTDNIPLRKTANLANALSDGEDYELLFVVKPKNKSKLLSEWPFRKTKLSLIGRFNDKITASKVLDSRGDDLLLKYSGGFDHFMSFKSDV